MFFSKGYIVLDFDSFVLFIVLGMMSCMTIYFWYQDIFCNVHRMTLILWGFSHTVYGVYPLLCKFGLQIKLLG